jgi:hypothetical protein
MPCERFFNAPAPSGWTFTIVLSRLTASILMGQSVLPASFRTAYAARRLLPNGLADPRKRNTNVSCVWGERLGAEKPIRNLGVFRSDDANDGRWVLACDDPQALKQIDSVFVTAESSKKSTMKPGGRRILVAFLVDQPSHP